MTSDRAMICPSCDHQSPAGSRYCGRCRMSFSPRNLLLLKYRDHFYWILRRAEAGFLSGVVAWFFIPGLSRVLAQDANSLIYFLAIGVLGGTFLGSVDGMVEESTPKTIRGAMLGGVGGALGGLIFNNLNATLPAHQLHWGFFVFWAIPGALIGLTSALWERKPLKITAGALLGFIGGGIGGALGNLMYYTLIKEFEPTHWVSIRLVEGFSGGLIGVTLWFAIGAAERFVIFKRNFVGGAEHKVCDHCDAKNALAMWYCGSCGSVLQQSAPAAKLNLSPYVTLDRLREMFLFLSRLCATTGVIAGIFAFVLLAPVNFFLALVALVLVAVVSYSLLLLFSSFAESIHIFIRK